MTRDTSPSSARPALPESAASRTGRGEPRSRGVRSGQKDYEVAIFRGAVLVP